MSTFEITIARKADKGCPVVVDRTSRGAVMRLPAEGVLALGSDAENALRETATAPQEYGSVLGQEPICDQVCDTIGIGITICRLRIVCSATTNRVARQLRPSIQQATSETKLRAST
jgi:hypothetical protein